MTDPCLGKGWDVVSDTVCQECSAANKCKDLVLHGPFHEHMIANPSITDTQLSQAMSITLPSIQALREEYTEFMGTPIPTPPQIPTPPPQIPTPPPQIPTPLPQIPTPPPQIPTPPPSDVRCKNRRGRMPADLVKCPYCTNGFAADGSACAVCGGYGDISQKKLTAYQQGGQSTTMAAGTPSVSTNKQPVAGNGVSSAVAGGDSSSSGVPGVLPIQRTSVPDSIQSSTANSGGDTQAETVSARKTSKRSKTVSGLERGAFFSIEELLSLSDGKITSVSLNNATGEMTLTVGLK
jgi:hypothetical protein